MGEGGVEIAMRASWIAGAFAATAIATCAFANENFPLQLRSKTAIATVAPHADAPFVSAVGEPAREPTFTPSETRMQHSRSACDSDSDFCYDADNGHIVYKPARKFMPDLPGLHPENISIKRDRVVFKYSF